MRSRNNSLRNGETSKVIETLGIEAPKMEKEQIEEYLRFKALKNSHKQQNASKQWSSGSAAPRDRKLSQEYFKEEAKRLDRKLQQGKHLAATGATANAIASASETTAKQPQKKRFTCFKAKNINVPTAFGLYQKMPNGF